MLKVTARELSKTKKADIKNADYICVTHSGAKPDASYGRQDLLFLEENATNVRHLCFDSIMMHGFYNPTALPNITLFSRLETLILYDCHWVYLCNLTRSLGCYKDENWPSLTSLCFVYSFGATRPETLLKTAHFFPRLTNLSINIGKSIGRGRMNYLRHQAFLAFPELRIMVIPNRERIWHTDKYTASYERWHSCMQACVTIAFCRALVSDKSDGKLWFGSILPILDLLHRLIPWIHIPYCWKFTSEKPAEDSQFFEHVLCDEMFAQLESIKSTPVPAYITSSFFATRYFQSLVFCRPPPPKAKAKKRKRKRM